MKYSALVAFSALALGGCMGPDGNPDGQPYANDPGGTIASQPAINGVVAYNPESQAPEAADTTAVTGMPATPQTPQPAPPRQ